MVENHGGADELLFMQLVSMFQVAAMQQLGKLMSPITNKVERDLVQAKLSIDTLEALKKKTTGNLSATEAEFLKKVIFELQMNYVDEVKAAETRDDEHGGEDTSDVSEGDGGDASDTPDEPSAADTSSDSKE